MDSISLDAKSVGRPWCTVLVFFCLLFLVSCGSGGGIQSTPGQGSGDAQKGSQEDPERQALLKEFETPEYVECRDDGFFYDRRSEECASELKTKGIACTRDGITNTFSSIGSPITEILDRSLGSPAVPGDRGEGYVIDQCGRSTAGRILVTLVKKGPDGKLQIREIDAAGSANKK